MKRRAFLQWASLSGLALAIPNFLGCSWSSIYAQIKAYVPVGVNAFIAVLGVLGANNISTTALTGGVNAVKGAFAVITAAIDAYNSAPADQKTTLLSKISLAISDATQNLNQFWSNLSIPDAKLATLIEGLLGVITSTLGAFAAQLPAAPTPTVALARAIRSVPKKRSVKQFKADFNKLLADAGQSQFALK